MDGLDDYVVYDSDDGDFIVIKESESSKLPNSNKYSECTIKCEVVEHHEGSDGDFYLVKNIKVKDKVKKQSEKKSSESSSSSSSYDSSYYSSSSQSSSDYGQSNSNGNNYESQSAPYIGNANTGKFHAASCRDVDKMNPSNMVELYSREDAINNGYTPCGHCGP